MLLLSRVTGRLLASRSPLWIASSGGVPVRRKASAAHMAPICVFQWPEIWCASSTADDQGSFAASDPSFYGRPSLLVNAPHPCVLANLTKVANVLKHFLKYMFSNMFFCFQKNPFFSGQRTTGGVTTWGGGHRGKEEIGRNCMGQKWSDQWGWSSIHIHLCRTLPRFSSFLFKCEMPRGLGLEL